MSQPISLFSKYSTNENRVTNYCGLMMKMLYEESPLQFEQLTNQLLTDNNPVQIEPEFQQQVKVSKSIPDLAILQRAVNLYFEVKLTDWFTDDQISRHVEGIANAHPYTRSFLFLLSNLETPDIQSSLNNARQLASEHQIGIETTTFEIFIEALKTVEKSETLENLVDDFESFLSNSGYLPEWKYLLDVVNCSGSMSEFDDGFYVCPNTGGPYRHARAKYFGPYKNKQVENICEIDGLVVFDQDIAAGRVAYLNSETVSGDELIQKARNFIEHSAYRSEELKSTPLQVFVLGKPYPTIFRKTSKGGMMGSKKYFRNIARECNSARELAEILNEQPWESVRNAA